MEVTKHTDGIITVANCFTAEECQRYIDFSEEKGYEEALIQTMFGQQTRNESVRNNDRVIYDDDLMAATLWAHCKSFLPMEIELGKACGLNERFRFYRYTKGQQFKPHKDGSYMRNIHEWSSYTLLFYLNDDYEGGLTLFKDLKVEPKMGMALVFPHHLTHEGMEVKSGTKYVLRTDVMYRRN